MARVRHLFVGIDVGAIRWRIFAKHRDAPCLPRASSVSRRIARTPDANRVLMTLTHAQVLQWFKETGRFPTLPLFDRQGQAIPQSALEAVARNVDREKVPASAPIRYGMAVRRG